MLLEISQNSQEITCARVSFLIKLQASSFTKKETLTQVISCKFCKLSKNTFLDRKLLMAASESTRKQMYRGFFNKFLAQQPTDKQPCWFYEIFHNRFFAEHFRVTTSEKIWKFLVCNITENQMISDRSVAKTTASI